MVQPLSSRRTRAQGRICAARAHPGKPPHFSGVSGIDQTMADRVAGDRDAVLEAELDEDVGPVALDGLLADDELLGDLAARAAVRDQRDDLALARGQGITAAGEGLPAPEEVAHERRDGL